MRMTSAPLSARYLETVGPTPTQAKSATRRPSNGFFIPSMSDHHLHAQFAQVGRFEAEQFAVHRLVMFADGRGAAALAPGSLAEDEGRAGVDEALADILVRDAHPVVAGGKLLALDD